MRMVIYVYLCRNVLLHPISGMALTKLQMRFLWNFWNKVEWQPNWAYRAMTPSSCVWWESCSCWWCIAVNEMHHSSQWNLSSDLVVMQNTEVPSVWGQHNWTETSNNNLSWLCGRYWLISSNYMFLVELFLLCFNTGSYCTMIDKWY